MLNHDSPLRQFPIQLSLVIRKGLVLASLDRANAVGIDFADALIPRIGELLGLPIDGDTALFEYPKIVDFSLATDD